MGRANPSTGKRPGLRFGAFRETPNTIWRTKRHEFNPHYNPTATIDEALRRIERLDHDLSRQPQITGGIAHRLRRETLARNAFATASIEGNPLTLTQVESLLAEPLSATTHDPDELEILNYAAFMASPRAVHAPHKPEDILNVHRELFHGVLPDAGEWKTVENFIGNRATQEVVYVPATAARVQPELQQALDWLHDARGVPPIARVLLFHHEFESIHPFRDGNGRTGRALTPMALSEFGYGGSALAAIDLVIHRERNGYYQNLVAVERNGFTDYTPWLEFTLGVVHTAYEEAVAGMLFQNALPAGVTSRGRSIMEWFGALHAQRPGQRVRFNDVHSAFPHIAERTLKRDLSALRDAGALEVDGMLKGTTYRLAPNLATGGV